MVQAWDGSWSKFTPQLASRTVRKGQILGVAPSPGVIPAVQEGCPRQDSNLRTRLRRPVPNAHPAFSSTLQSQIHCLQPPRLALVDARSSHEPLHPPVHEGGDSGAVTPEP